MIAQSARVNPRRNERRSQGMHLHQRRQVPGISEIVGELAFGQAGAGGRFHRHNACPALALDLAAHIGHHQSRKVRSPAGAAHNHIGLVSGQRHLLQGFLADHRLVQQHMIQHAAQRVFGVRVFRGHFHGF